VFRRLGASVDARIYPRDGTHGQSGRDRRGSCAAVCCLIWGRQEGVRRGLTRKYSYERAHAALESGARCSPARNRQASAFFEAQPPGYKKIAMFWVMSAKKAGSLVDFPLASRLRTSARGRRRGRRARREIANETSPTPVDHSPGNSDGRQRSSDAQTANLQSAGKTPFPQRRPRSDNAGHVGRNRRFSHSG